MFRDENREELLCRATILWSALPTTRMTILTVRISQTNEAAKEHGHRIVRELKEGGYSPGDAALLIHDEAGQIVHSITF